MEAQSTNQRCEEYERTWSQAMKHSREIMGEEDFDFVQGFRDVTQLLAEVQRLEDQYANSTIPRLLKGLKPHLHHLHYFATFLMASIGSQIISSACVWGVTCLLIQLASNHHDSLDKIATHLNQLGQKLRLFETYKESVDLEPEDVSLFFDLLVDFLLNCAIAIKFFRKHDTKPSGEQWPKVQRQFTKTAEELSQRLENLKKLAEARSITQMNQKWIERSNEYNIADSGTRQVAKLPCWHLPFSRNPRFFGRETLLDQIHEAFQSLGPDRSIRSIALWGTGGIGKSQVALEYANRQIQAKCTLIIWLPAENENEISNAIVDVANKVQPPGYVEGSSPDKIRYTMWNWLQITDTPWLLIFDNVEDNNLLLQNWPAAGNGQILVTCRSELLAASPAAQAVEIPPFTPDETTELLLKIAARTDPDEEELQATRQIATALGDLALGIGITARHILVKKKSMKEFLPYFMENRPTMMTPPRYAPKNPYYSRHLLSVWEIAFGGLSRNSSKILGVLCLIAPDGIPRNMLIPKNPLNHALSFLCDQIKCEDAQEELLYNSLIRINESLGTISIHRLTQEAYYFRLTEEEKHEAFKLAYRLLAHSFPKRTHGRHLYSRWNECEALVHHVSALSAKYDDLKQAGLDIQEPEWAILMADVTWFCAEVEMLPLGEQLGLRAAEYWTDKNSLEYAYICESIATVAHRHGQYVSAYDYFDQALQVRKKSILTTNKVLADSYSAVGLALTGLFRSEEAIQYVNVAQEIAEKVPDEERKSFNYDRYLRNLAGPAVALGRYEAAKIYLDKAEDFQATVYGTNSHFDGETAYIRGSIEEKQGHLDLAAQYFQRSYELQSPGKPTHQSVAASRYHQALICLRRPDESSRRKEEALEYLQHALRVCKFNEARRGDSGNSARVMWQMAKIWQSQGLRSKAAPYEAMALKVKVELQQLGKYPVAPDAEQSWDCFSDLLYR